MINNKTIEDLWNILKFTFEPNKSRKEWDELMKKKVFRKLRKLANKYIGEEETNKIIDETIEEFKEEIKVNSKKKKNKKAAKK